MKRRIMLYFIWVFTVCKKYCLGVSSIQKVNLKLLLYNQVDFSILIKWKGPFQILGLLSAIFH